MNTSPKDPTQKPLKEHERLLAVPGGTKRLTSGLIVPRGGAAALEALAVDRPDEPTSEQANEAWQTWRERSEYTAFKDIFDALEGQLENYEVAGKLFKLDLSVYDETAARTALNDALNHITITQLRSMREAGMDSEHPYALIANFVPTKKFSHSELETANAKLNPDDHFEALDYRDQYTEDQLNGDYRTKSGQEGFVVEFIPVEPNINAAKQKDQIDQLDRLNSIEGANWSVPGDASSMIYQQVLADKGLLTGDDNPSKTSIVRLDLESKAGDPDSYRNLAWDELVDMFRPITYRVDYGRAFLVGAGVDVDKDVSRVAIKPKFD